LLRRRGLLASRGQCRDICILLLLLHLHSTMLHAPWWDCAAARRHRRPAAAAC
jgi:hypothetical protein